MNKTKTEKGDDILAQWTIGLEARKRRIDQFFERIPREPVLQERLRRFRAEDPEDKYPLRLVAQEPVIHSVAAIPKHGLVSVKASDALEVALVKVIVHSAGKILAEGEATKVGDDTHWVYRLPETLKSQRVRIEAIARNHFDNEARRKLDVTLNPIPHAKG